MREQVVAQKVGNRSGIGRSKSGVGQRPAKRASDGNDCRAAAIAFDVRAAALRIGVIAIIALIGFVGYRAAASASFFQVERSRHEAPSRASVDDIKNAVRRDVGETGVWRADLQQLSTASRTFAVGAHRCCHTCSA